MTEIRDRILNIILYVSHACILICIFCVCVAYMRARARIFYISHIESLNYVLIYRDYKLYHKFSIYQIKISQKLL